MKDEIIQNVKKLLSFKTYKENTKQFEKAFSYVQDYFKDSNLYLKEYEFDGRKGISISNTKETNVDIIFCTHMDVVYHKDYVVTEDDINLYGRGTIDMKGQTGTVMTLMKHLNTSLKVTQFITSDEEIDGMVASKMVKNYNSKIAIVPDGGSNFDLITEEKGLIQLKISVYGKSYHSAKLWNGENAILKLINIYEKLIKIYPLPKSEDDFITSINLSKIEGGDNSYNQVPDKAYMVLDIRNVHKDTKEQIIKDIKLICNDCQIEEITSGTDFITNLEDENVKEYIKASEEVLGKPIVKKGCSSTSDAIYFYEKGIPTVIMNPIGDFPHADNEYVNKESLITLYKIYEKFIKEMEENK